MAAATPRQIGLEQAIDLVEDLTVEEKEEIKEWVRKGKSIDVLVTGKTGTGKSSLLNYLLGKKIFPVGKSKNVPCTSEVTFKEAEKNGIMIRAWDSPGLQDGTGDKKYLKDLQDKCSNVDLMLYCISMEEVRSDLHMHTSAIRKICDLFEKRCWKHTVFVLTFANAMVHVLKAQGLSEDQIKMAFKARIDEWRDSIQAALRDLNVDKEIVENIQVIPAGHPRETHLPGYHHWLSYMWSHCLLSMRTPAQAALIRMEVNSPQGGFITEDEAPNGFNRVSADERKIIFTKDVKTAMGLAAGGLVAGGFAIGAAIGATIGALAIGIPSFGVGAGAGVGIGGVLGGAIGGGIATGVGALIALYRRRKMKRKN